MAKTTTKRKAVGRRKSASKATGRAKAPVLTPWRKVRWWTTRVALGFAVLVLVLITAVAIFPPPTTPYQFAEARRLGAIKRTWVDLENIAPVMARSVVAAEDANFCLHWGFDMAAIRDALDEGASRGASTLSQQVVKNVYLWHGRSWARKALEASLTPLLEAVWTKRRIVEVYLNVVEFGEGVFGVEAAAQEFFGVPAAKLTAEQAARLAAVLPAPKQRSAINPSAFTRERARAIQDGAETIRQDGRAACFES